MNTIHIEYEFVRAIAMYEDRGVSWILIIRLRSAREIRATTLSLFSLVVRKEVVDWLS